MTVALTFCEACEHVEAASRKQPPHRWLCRRHRRVLNDSFVTAKSWTQTDPFLRCASVNAGACPLFEPLRYPSGGDHAD